MLVYKPPSYVSDKAEKRVYVKVEPAPKKQTDFMRVGLIFVVISLVYFLIQIGMIYYDYYDVKNEAKQQIRAAAANTEKQMLNYFLSEIDRRNINLKQEDIKIIKTEDYASITIKFEEVLTYFGLPVHKLKFRIKGRTQALLASLFMISPALI